MRLQAVEHNATDECTFAVFLPWKRGMVSTMKTTVESNMVAMMNIVMNFASLAESRAREISVGHSLLTVAEQLLHKHGSTVASRSKRWRRVPGVARVLQRLPYLLPKRPWLHIVRPALPETLCIALKVK